MPEDEYSEALRVAEQRARDWLASVAQRPINPNADVDEIKDALGRILADEGQDAAAVVDHLATAIEPGLIAMASPRFYGFVIGGTYPAALAADWLVSAWDQNTGSRTPTPGAAAVEELAAAWLLDLLGLPAGSGVGFVTGATMANFSCLLAARGSVLRAAGWDVERHGLQGAPRVRFLAGDAVHSSMVVAGRMAGFGLPRTVGADPQGRIDVDGLVAALGQDDGPVIVALQAGDVHSGAFDDFAAAIAVAHAAGAWVHIDGAFGLWAGASPALRHLVAGYEAADSWATDAHKTLDVPYDSGVAIVADEAAMGAALAIHAAYLPEVGAVAEPYDHTPELSRRARGIPVWATLSTLGRHGVADLVDGMVAAAKGLADGFAETPGLEVLNDVVFTQVCVAADDDTLTGALADRLRADGVAWASPSRWHDRAIVRFSVSNRGTDATAVERTIGAVRSALAAVRDA
ncbi:pyridoxal phosphate-dependent decarboxylase family protein [Agromyces ramosus]|uniref:Glutamate/tyrosine decarboxylase-like PLP-dependent enzyme n=1 Tax=Agromyces ramosus TaxID=33879 RepID=A0ABU0R8D9_9MICO|nr:pyridoxal-dependent decarboxylase [Agromyces ramosus]MDQ0894042.1 glutamate/tyrosine decarboxylase-like PLP-dependent enzyme [Agromyces ramosus]